MFHQNTEITIFSSEGNIHPWTMDYGTALTFSLCLFPQYNGASQVWEIMRK